MIRNARFGVVLVVLIVLASSSRAEEFRTLSRSELLDRIRGGWAGQMIGDIQGLPFEFKYKNAPGPLPDFVPNLPRCKSDDDTDVEWVNLMAMDRLGVLEVPYPELAREWIRSINRNIWVSNKTARELMGQGILPPWTSHGALNPHARYNLSGQFCAESYGFLAPGLPAASARIGAHYTHITVRGEPIQACAYWTSMVSLAFFERDIERLADRSLGAVDPASQHAEMVKDILAWYRAAPEDWIATRAKIQKKFRDERHWNMNATVTNGGLVLAALLYGKGDFALTLRLAFALGYDADCNAATCGAILGVMHGARSLEAHRGWVLPTIYENRTRDGLPKTQTMDEVVAVTARLAEKVILANGGKREGDRDAMVYRLPVREPALLEHLEPDTTETSESVQAAIDREALERLSSESVLARMFAAIRLARHKHDGLGAAESGRVRRILSDALEDPVLAPLAKAALDSLAVAPRRTLRACFRIHFSFVFVQGKGDEASD